MVEDNNKNNTNRDENVEKFIKELPNGYMMFREQHFNGLYTLGNRNLSIIENHLLSRAHNKFLQINEKAKDINLEVTDDESRNIFLEALLRYAIDPAFCVGFRHGWDNSVECDKGACYNKHENSDYDFECSECDFNIESLVPNYCPKCGMRVFDNKNKAANINRAKL